MPPQSYVCWHCGDVFQTRLSHAQRAGEGKYCSRKCYHDGRRRSLADRFWEKVHKTRKCWFWIGARKGGQWPYGNIVGADGKHYEAHRVSWILHHGPIPVGLWILHRCDIALCVRPTHLFLGTAAENSADMVRKGRVHSKLTAEQVRAIRRRYVPHECSGAALAAEYGVSRALIHRILARQIWRGVE